MLPHGNKGAYRSAKNSILDVSLSLSGTSRSVYDSPEAHCLGEKTYAVWNTYNLIPLAGGIAVFLKQGSQLFGKVLGGCCLCVESMESTVPVWAQLGTSYTDPSRLSTGVAQKPEIRTPC